MIAQHWYGEHTSDLTSIQIFDRSYCKRYSDTGKQLLNTNIHTLRYPAVINILELVWVLGVWPRRRCLFPHPLSVVVSEFSHLNWTLQRKNSYKFKRLFYCLSPDIIMWSQMGTNNAICMWHSREIHLR